MAENVRVVVRCRPMNKREHELKCRNIVQIENCTVSLRNPSDQSAPDKTFTFDSVYDSLATTESLYNDVCYSLVENVLEGYNGTIFAYGQTGCGKTHTMQGPDTYDASGQSVPSAQRGIITRSFDHIFEAISVASDVQFLALVSYLEIYNENIRDLLNPHEGVNANHALKELPGLGVTVPTMSSHTVTTAHECYELLNMGNRNRMVGATLMNATSSRSHSIFTISVEQMHNDATGDADNVAVVTGGIRRGKLNLVDLAGSERQNKTGAVGDRLKEATKINLSLSALGNVISALVDGKTKHIPYRDSKLTRLLQDSLGGNTKTLMISCISPADNNYDETISTLRYASRAKNIANKPKINEDPKDAKLREYQEEILKLKQMLNSSNNNSNSNVLSAVANAMPSEQELAAQQRQWLEAERAKLKAEMEQEMQRLKEEHSQQQHEKETRMQDIEHLRQHYEAQLKQLSTTNETGASAEHNATAETIGGGATPSTEAASTLQLEARKRIEAIKRALIGGERANDTQLKERRQKKKLDAQRRLSALAHVLSRVEQSEDRDLLQGHYTNIQQELNAKNEYLKAYRQKVKALEREVSDLQAEFQLDRADYLESIRRLERNLKFSQQLMDKALPILRKDGKYWDPMEILQNSTWNDDLKVWKLPETSMNSFKLPPATNGAQVKGYFDTGGIKYVRSAAYKNPTIIYNNNNNNNHNHFEEQDNKDEEKKDQDKQEQQHEFLPTEIRTSDNSDNDDYKSDILNNYFRSNRQKTADPMAQQRKGFSHWKDFAQRHKRLAHAPHFKKPSSMQAPSLMLSSNGELNHSLNDITSTIINNHNNNYNSSSESNLENHVLSSWLPAHASKSQLMNQTWAGYGSERRRLLTATLKNGNTNTSSTHQASTKLPLEQLTGSVNMPPTSLLPPLQPLPPLRLDAATATMEPRPMMSARPPTLPLHLQPQRRRPHKVAALEQAFSKCDTNNNTKDVQDN